MPTVEVDTALCRCVLYEALSVGLYAPSPASLERLCAPATRAALADAARRLAPADEESPLRRSVAAWSARLAEPLEIEDVESAYGRLFGHTARGEVCAYESEFGTETHFQQTARLADVGGFYAAFGLKQAEHRGERVDHVCSELEFLGFLARKEAFALHDGDPDMLRETRKATRLFLRDHLGRFARAFARQLADKDGDGFYARVADALFEFVTSECARTGVQPGAPFVTMRPDDDESTPLECGGCDLAGRS